MDWTYKHLKLFILTPPWLYEKVQSLKIRTISHPTLTILRDEFYKDRQKVLPKNIADIMSDPLALAVWFMDDGNIVRKNAKVVGYNLNTQSFSKKENEHIVRIFKDVHQINFLLDKNKGKYRLGVWQKQSREAFSNLIEEYVIPSMQYKLG